MTSKKNGQLPAFAVPLDMSKYHTDTGVFPAGCGLTKREYFAAMAMQGMLAGFPNYIPEPSEIIPYSVNFADQLLKALES